MKIRLQIGVLALFACQSNVRINGQEIGSFTFTATPISNDCPFAAVPAIDGGSFTFDGILSRDPNSTQAFMIVGNIQRDAGFDGQIFTSEAAAPRHFAECVCDPVQMDETLRVALLSSTQDEAVGRSCPPNPLDGGIPGATPDGGVAPPCPSSNPCDVARACGELVDVVIPDGGGCQCSSCTMVYSITAERKAGR